jgi:hypothetical protein
MFQLQKCNQFYWLNKREVTDAAVLVIADYLSKIACDFNERFSHSKKLIFQLG